MKLFLLEMVFAAGFTSTNSVITRFNDPGRVKKVQNCNHDEDSNFIAKIQYIHEFFASQLAHKALDVVNNICAKNLHSSEHIIKLQKNLEKNLEKHLQKNSFSCKNDLKKAIEDAKSKKNNEMISSAISILLLAAKSLEKIEELNLFFKNETKIKKRKLKEVRLTYLRKIDKYTTEWYLCDASLIFGNSQRYFDELYEDLDTLKYIYLHD
ncbi:hypothetical protein ENBRE01_1669 [Enteropsectra breve]|nr:hypothetical protein ENBRE01_1669 [Enteropsectra breve]